MMSAYPRSPEGSTAPGVLPMVVNVSPNCMNMELIRAISSGLLPSAMQQARVDMERASSQDCKTNYLLVVI